jgi:hypothetical protein
MCLNLSIQSFLKLRSTVRFCRLRLSKYFQVNRRAKYIYGLKVIQISDLFLCIIFANTDVHH